MKSRLLTCITAMTLFAALANPVRIAAQEHLRYKLVVLGTLGGPQSYGDAGHGAANITSQGRAVGVADTSDPDPFYPNFNPVLSGLIGPYPFIYHAFTTRGGALADLGGLPFAGLPRGGDSNATFITENGLVSGQALNGSIDPISGWPAEDPVLWKDGQIINLGSLGGYEGQTSRVNSRGQVAGFTTNAVLILSPSFTQSSVGGSRTKLKHGHFCGMKNAGCKTWGLSVVLMPSQWTQATRPMEARSCLPATA